MLDCSCNTFPASLGNVTFGASVGVGTTSPARALHVAGTDAGVAIQDTSSGGHQYVLTNVSSGDGTLGLYDATAGAFRWVVSSQSVTAINPSGNAVVQLFADGAPSSMRAVTVGYGDTYDGVDIGEAGYVQAEYQGVAYEALVLNPLGGYVGVGVVQPYVAFPAAPLHVLTTDPGELARFEGGWQAQNARNYITLYATNPGFWWEFSNQDTEGGGTINGLALCENSGGGGSQCRLYLAQGGFVGVGPLQPYITFPAVPLHVLTSEPGELARFEGGWQAQTTGRNYISLYNPNTAFHWELSDQDETGNSSTNGLAFNEVSGEAGGGTRLYLAQGGQVRVNTLSTAYPQVGLLVQGQIAWLDSTGTSAGHVDPEAQSLVLYGRTVADSGGCYYAT